MGSSRIGVRELADAIGAAVPHLDPVEQRIAVGLYRLLARGEPVRPEELAAAIGVTPDRVHDALGSWPGVYRDEDGRVVGFWGLALGPLDPEYRFHVGGRTLYTWCAWDTLFIPAILEGIARVEATCPVTGRTVSLVVDPAGVRVLEPASPVVSMVVPEGPFGFDVVESFCHRVLSFASTEAGIGWTADHPGTTLLSVEEAFEVGRRHVRRLASAVLGDRGA